MRKSIIEIHLGTFSNSVRLKIMFGMSDNLLFDLANVCKLSLRNTFIAWIRRQPVNLIPYHNVWAKICLTFLMRITFI